MPKISGVMPTDQIPVPPRRAVVVTLTASTATISTASNSGRSIAPVVRRPRARRVVRPLATAATISSPAAALNKSTAASSDGRQRPAA